MRFHTDWSKVDIVLGEQELMNIFSGALEMTASMYQLNQQNLYIHFSPGNSFEDLKFSSLNVQTKKLEH